jgi:hypothetical protein
MKESFCLTTACLATAFFFSCNNSTRVSSSNDKKRYSAIGHVQKHLTGYATVKLTTDLSQLTDKEKQMIPLLIDAAKIMDTLYWDQSYGQRDSLLNAVTDEPTKHTFFSTMVRGIN